MALTAADIINGDSGARVTLIDAAKVTWSDLELLGYLNEALTALVFVKPDAHTTQAFVTLASGELQELPASAVALLDISRNSDANGGRVITQVDEALLKEASRFWPAGTKQAEVEHFTADPRNARRFRVYPPNNGSGSVEILYGSVPAALTALTDALPVPDSYQNALVCFVLAKAYAKNSKKQDLTKSSGYMQQWGQMLGLKSKAQVAVAPRVTDSPGLA